MDEFAKRGIQMECSRLFLIGLVVLFLGIQLRLVKTYELNDKASQFVESRLSKPTDTLASSTAYGYSDEYWLDLPGNPPVPRHSITPPRWLGWSFVSVGAILVLTCPCFRN